MTDVAKTRKSFDQRDIFRFIVLKSVVKSIHSKEYNFLTLPVGFQSQLVFEFEFELFYVLYYIDLRNLQEKVENSFCSKNCTDLSM